MLCLLYSYITLLAQSYRSQVFTRCADAVVLGPCSITFQISRLHVKLLNSNKSVSLCCVLFTMMKHFSRPACYSFILIMLTQAYTNISFVNVRWRLNVREYSRMPFAWIKFVFECIWHMALTIKCTNIIIMYVRCIS